MANFATFITFLSTFCLNESFVKIKMRQFEHELKQLRLLYTELIIFGNRNNSGGSETVSGQHGQGKNGDESGWHKFPGVDKSTSHDSR